MTMSRDLPFIFMESRECKRCGSSDRNPSGRCRPCQRAANSSWYNSVAGREWRRANAVRLRTYQSVYCDVRRGEKSQYDARRHAANPQRKIKAVQRWAAMNRERQKKTMRNCHLKKKFGGMTNADYDSMLALQNGVCAICQTSEPGFHGGKHFAVDHDHITGGVRQLLCNRCNAMLGNARDRIDILTGAAAYLRKHRHQRCPKFTGLRGCGSAL